MTAQEEGPYELQLAGAKTETPNHHEGETITMNTTATHVAPTITPENELREQRKTRAAAMYVAMGSELAAILADREMTVATLSRETGISPHRLQRMIAGRGRWTVESTASVGQALHADHGQHLAEIGFRAAAIVRAEQ